jgi:aerobic-type carbon monoxide dehydrogenase small subunit (CoxS/CutS family)
VLRRQGLHGVKRGCSTGDCGACAVLVDGRAMNSCLLFAAQMEGCEVLTIEGLGTPAAPHPLMEAFVAEGAVQCGFCTPAMLLSAHALLRERPVPSEAEVRDALDGHLCRCTGYVKPIRAVLRAAGQAGSARSLPAGSLPLAGSVAREIDPCAPTGPAVAAGEAIDGGGSR